LPMVTGRSNSVPFIMVPPLGRTAYTVNANTTFRRSSMER
jgi:hypothetical protein